MWYALRGSPEVRVDPVSTARELLQPVWRRLVVVIGVVFVLVAMALLPDQSSWSNMLLVSIVVVSSALTLLLLRRRPLASQVVWQAGLAAAITFALHTFRHPEIAFSFTLLPLIASVTVGWPAGLAVNGLATLLLWGLGQSAFLPSLPTSYVLGILFGGAFTALIGGVATHALLIATQWSFSSYEQARANMEEARQRRMEVLQIQEDLVRANQELTRLSERLKALYRVAEEARRAKEEFVANVSHELRTSLNMIIGFSEMIPRSSRTYGIELPQPLLSDIAAIHRNSQHLAKLVDDVLDLSQMEAGQMAITREWTSLDEVVDAAITAVGALYQSKGLFLEREIPPDLPAVFCDATRIRQVVINLLSNAGRFTQVGGVCIRAWREGDDVLVSVADTGPGIAPGDQERLFEPFQQLDSSIRRRHDGSGLGLCISRRFVEMHGGKMRLESQLGVGTTITFGLPLQAPPPIDLADTMPRYNPYGQFDGRARRSRAPLRRVLPRFVIVEQGGTLHRLFDRYADEVEAVSTPDLREAIRELGRSPAQALIVNAPPSANGPSSVDLSASLPLGTPAITCWVPGPEEAAARLGVVRYLTKPVLRDALLATLQELGEGVRSILLVDDEPEALQLLSRMLVSAQERYRLLYATNGQRALSLLRERRPDLMLLDLVMPDTDGFQVLQEKSRDATIQHIPVIAVSGQDPTGGPTVSEGLALTLNGGLGARDLLDCIRAISDLLAPSVRPADRARPGRPAG